MAAPTVPQLLYSVTGGAVLDKLPLLVACDLENRFLKEGWPVGRIFGLDTKLSETYGVGRDVLREAVRLLEARNHARMRRGPLGGLEVVLPGLNYLVGAFRGYAYISELEPKKALEAWIVLQTVAVRLITAKPATEAPAGLDALVVSLIDAQSYCPVTFGCRLIDLAASPLLSHLAMFIKPLLPQMGVVKLRSEIGALNGALEGFGAAEAIMAWLRECLGSLELEFTSVPSNNFAFSPPDAPDNTCFRTQAMQMVHSLMCEISPGIWRKGHLIGNEFDLADRYGVDKSVVRQAIRLMEDAEVATAEPGRGKGLVTRLPGTAPLSRLLCAFVVSHVVQVDDAEQVFSALRVECAGAAAKNARPCDVITLMSLVDDLNEIQAPVPVAALQLFERVQQHICDNPLLNVCIDGVKAFLSLGMESKLIASVEVIAVYAKRTEKVFRAICTHDVIGSMAAEEEKLVALAHARRIAV